MAFTFEIKGIEGLQKKLEDHPEKVKEALAGVLETHVTEINEEQVRNAQRFTDRGEIARGINWEPDGPLNYRLFSQAPYSAAMEFGTQKKFTAIAGVDAAPYRGPWSMKTGKTLSQAILAWVKRKGIAYGTTFKIETRRKKGGKAQAAAEKTAAFLIARSIAKNGVAPQPFFFTPFLSRKERIKADVEEAINKV